VEPPLPSSHLQTEPPSQWQVYERLSQEQFKFYEKAGIEALQAQLLYNRGITTPEAMRTFLAADYAQTPDPLTLIDMQKARDRIVQAQENGEHITVYGDYDADGVTSSSLLTRALRTLIAHTQSQAVLDYYIPHRLYEGCGLNLPALDLLKARGTELIITTDCASSDVEQVEYARTLGIDVIITDHHQPPETVPAAYAMVNPWRPECTYGERYLCGVGVAFKLVQALFRHYGLPREQEMDYLDLVAVGTIADLAALKGENHTLVRLGLQKMNTPALNPGLRALMQLASMQPGRIRERDIAYGISPRINAAGRMKHASIAFELLTTDDEARAREIAAQLEEINQSRQQQTEELMQAVRLAAQEQSEKQVILVSGENWHEGILGLVAGKLSEEINKPVLVLSEDREKHLSRGSARSQKGFNIISALRAYDEAHKNHLERYGGHEQAAGFTIQSEHVSQFHDYLLERAQAPAPDSTDEEDKTGLESADSLSNDPSEPIETPEASRGDLQGRPEPEASRGDLQGRPEPEATTVDTERAIAPAGPKVDLVFTRFDLLNYETYQKIRNLAPFGAGNPEPTFKMERLRLMDSWTSGLERRNLRLRLGVSHYHFQRVGTILRGAAQLPSLSGISHVNIIFRLETNSYPDEDGKYDIWLKILHVEPAG
jgi:single-stranded-DNA-specific exonuclease